jgi:hypothetical protein
VINLPLTGQLKLAKEYILKNIASAKSPPGLDFENFSVSDEQVSEEIEKLWTDELNKISLVGLHFHLSPMSTLQALLPLRTTNRLYFCDHSFKKLQI